MHIFISYSSKDEKEAFFACEILEQNGKKCFIAPRDIRPGKEYAEELINGIDDAYAMVLFFSNNANQSPHVLREVERAVSKSIPIIICKLEEVEMSKSMQYFLMTHQWLCIDKRNDYYQLINHIEQLQTQQSTINHSVAKEKIQPKKSIIAALVFLICVLILGTYFYGRISGKKDSDEKNSEEKISEEISVGDIITFGTYNEEPIEWYVLRIDNEDAVLISKDIITMKAFDVAEGGEYNYYEGKDYWNVAVDSDLQLQTMIRGNSDWSTSNLRTWLNSDKQVVEYKDQPPKSSAMSEKKNGYHNESGFLSNFTEDELKAIQETTVITQTNAIANASTVTTTDKVYLLSIEELTWFEDAGLSTLAIPTEAALEQDQSGWYEMYKDTFGISEYCWWLRDAVSNMGCKCYLVGNGYYDENIQTENAGLEGYGVRPAITVDLDEMN